MTEIHTCSYYCDRPECVRQQRDELRDRLEAALASAPPSGGEVVAGAEHRIAEAGAFAGLHGLRGLADSASFWEGQPYGTRLYYGEGALDYLHRDVLRAAIRALDTAPPSAPVGVLSAIAGQLRLAGAALPAPQVQGTPESGVITGLSIALALVESALAQQPAGVDGMVMVQASDLKTLAEFADRGMRGNQAKLAALRAKAILASQQPAAPSVGAVAWLRMKPDGTPDWAEDCIGSDDTFLDHEMASDGYYLQPLYTAPQQPAGVDWASAEKTIADALRSTGLVTNSDKWRAAEAVIAALAAQQQGGAE